MIFELITDNTLSKMPNAKKKFCPNLTLAEGQAVGIGRKIFTIAGLVQPAPLDVSESSIIKQVREEPQKIRLCP